MDFTVKTYNNLLLFLSLSNYPVYSVIDFINNKPSHGLIIRHDVDRFSSNALIIAELEHFYNFNTSYYFRFTKSAFNPLIITKISDMGHEIGYHYEELSIAKNNINKAINLFDQNLSIFRKYADIKTISMHGSPLSSYDSRDLWKHYNLIDFGLTAETYLSIDYENIYYFTDTGRSWNNNSINLRDNVFSGKHANLDTTNDLISFLYHHRNELIMIVSHPERWESSILGFTRSFFMDIITNYAKRFIKYIR